MRRTVLSAAILTAFLAAGCAEQPIFEDRSDQVTIKHRVPSK